MEKYGLGDLHNVLFEELLKVKDSENLPRETQKKVLESAMVFSSLSKQIINNADVVLRAQKLVYDKKIPDNAVIAMMIGHGGLNGNTIEG